MLILFFLLWIIFNGRITTEIVIFGVLISALVYAFICKFMDYDIQKEIRCYRKLEFLLNYIWVLVKEIVKANLIVIHMILTERERIEPVIVKFKTNLKSESARVLLANSITLTPGTFTISLEKDEYLVHCLDRSLAEGIEDSVFVKLLEKAEEKGEM